MTKVRPTREGLGVNLSGFLDSLLVGKSFGCVHIDIERKNISVSADIGK